MTIQFDRFYRYAEFTQLLKDFASRYPDLIALESAGKSFEGRDIWIITATNRKTGAAEDKPAFWVDANIHAAELAETIKTIRNSILLFSRVWPMATVSR